MVLDGNKDTFDGRKVNVRPCSGVAPHKPHTWYWNGKRYARQCPGVSDSQRTEATFSVQERHHDYLLQVERRGRALLAHAKEQGGLGDQVEDCRYILEGEGLWKDVLE